MIFQQDKAADMLRGDRIYDYYDKIQDYVSGRRVKVDLNKKFDVFVEQNRIMPLCKFDENAESIEDVENALDDVYRFRTKLNRTKGPVSSNIYERMEIYAYNGKSFGLDELKAYASTTERYLEEKGQDVDFDADVFYERVSADRVIFKHLINNEMDRRSVQILDDRLDRVFDYYDFPRIDRNSSFADINCDILREWDGGNDFSRMYHEIEEEHTVNSFLKKNYVLGVDVEKKKQDDRSELQRMVEDTIGKDFGTPMSKKMDDTFEEDFELEDNSLLLPDFEI